MLIELEKRNNEEIRKLITKEVDTKKQIFYLEIYYLFFIGRRKKKT